MTAPANSANGAMLSPQATMIEVWSGGFVDLARPDPATLELGDVAHAMSLTCRYGGHVREFYSVAEHAVLVHDLLASLCADKALCKAALFHDAAEAYLGDVVAPLKYALSEEEALEWFPCPPTTTNSSAYDRLTDRLEAAICERFDVGVDELGSEQLRTADMWALRIEARALTASGGAHWRWPGALPNDGKLPTAVAWHGGDPPPLARERWSRRVGQCEARP